MPEYKVQEVKKSKYILVHYGIFKIGWDWLILLCTFYTAVMVPYNAAFTLRQKNQRDSIYSDVVVEILFMFGKFPKQRKHQFSIVTCSLLAFCRLLITFANINPDQESQNICPVLVPNRLIVFRKELFLY